MKTLISLTLLLSGCATQPLTFEERMELVRTMQGNYHPIEYHPQIAPIPQTRIITCTRSDGTTYVCQ